MELQSGYSGDGWSQELWLDHLAVDKDDLWGLWLIAGFYGELLGIVPIVWVKGGIYPDFRCGFLREKRGAIVVSCVAGCGHEMRSWQSAKGGPP